MTHEPDRFPYPDQTPDFEDTIPDRHLVDAELEKLAKAEFQFRSALDVLCDVCGDQEADGALLDAWGEGVKEAVEAVLPGHDWAEAVEYYEGIYKAVNSPRARLRQSLETPIAAE